LKLDYSLYESFFHLRFSKLRIKCSKKRDKKLIKNEFLKANSSQKQMAECAAGNLLNGTIAIKFGS